MRLERNIVSLAVAVSIIACIPLASVSSAAATGTQYFVSPAGNDSSNGTSPSSAVRTIQKAVDIAQPGDVINLDSGIYMQDVVSRRDGTTNAPITIQGPETAVVKGAGAVRMVQINHDYITLQGFTLDGLFGDASSMSGYRDKLLFVLGKQTREGVNGLRVLHMSLRNAGGECVRLRYYAHDNEIAFNTILNCGVYDFRFGASGQVGEGVYIGTAPEQLNDGKNPTNDPDVSTRNWIHDNFIDTEGAECVDIKEAAIANLIENNRCTSTKQPTSGGFSVRGNGNIFRYNESFNNTGAGMRLGGDTAADGLNNDIYGNNFHDNAVGGIKFERVPQGKVCGNTMLNNAGGDSAGSYRSQFNPALPCVDVTATPALSPTKTTSPSPTSTSTSSATPTSIPTNIPRPTATPQWTPLPTNIPTPAATATALPTNTPTLAPTAPTKTPLPMPTSTAIPDACSRSYSINGNTPSFLEAELFSAVSGTFVEVADTGRSGANYMKVPGTGMRADPNTSLSFSMTVTSGGTFYIWLLGYGLSSGADSFYISLDAGSRIQGDVTRSVWGWHKIASSLNVPDGLHVLWMTDREDGSSVDKILLTKDAKLQPSGLGGPPQALVCQ